MPRPPHITGNVNDRRLGRPGKNTTEACVGKVAYLPANFSCQRKRKYLLLNGFRTPGAIAGGAVIEAI